MASKTDIPGFFEDDGSWPLIRRVITENFPAYALRYAIAFFFMLLVAGTTALSAWIMKDIVESLFVDRDFSKIVFVAVIIMVIFSVKGISTYCQSVILARIGNSIVAQIQMRLYDRILMQGGDFYTLYPSHDLVTRIAKNSQDARGVIDLVVTGLGRDLLTLIGLLIVMFIQDPVLTLSALLIAPPVIVFVSTLVRRVKKVAKQRFLSSTEVISAMQDTSAGIKIIKSFAMERQMRVRMKQSVDDVAKRNNKMAALSARTSPVMEVLGGFCIALMILYAGWRVSASGQTPAEFMAFLTALLLAYEPAKRIARLHVNLEAGLVGVRLMYEILDGPLLVSDKVDAKPLQVTTGNVVLKGVDFSYRTEENTDLRVLSRIDLLAKGGQTTALVGPSGSGKTTIINLIQRFYDVDGGAIEIDGQNIGTVTLETLRANIAFVSQDTFLFAGTVYQNILAGRPDASNAEVEEAARNANAHSFIEELEKGYDTYLGENGAVLSGGQKQRIAIARAILKDAAIVLLDEATSALDTESERLVQQAFDKLKDGRTTLVIAHRLSTIRNADCIHVLQAGKVIESGLHSELLKTGKLYRYLHDLQFKPDPSL